MFTLLDLCVSSLRRGHANLLCIVPILTDDPRRESEYIFKFDVLDQLHEGSNADVLVTARASDWGKSIVTIFMAATQRFPMAPQGINVVLLCISAAILYSALMFLIKRGNAQNAKTARFGYSTLAELS